VATHLDDELLAEGVAAGGNSDGGEIVGTALVCGRRQLHRLVVAAPVDAWDFRAHRPQIRGELRAVVDGMIIGER
jgi:hypothetical protein